MESNSGDQDVVLRIWTSLTEISEQLDQNRSLSVSLHGLAGGIKVRS